MTIEKNVTCPHPLSHSHDPTVTCHDAPLAHFRTWGFLQAFIYAIFCIHLRVNIYITFRINTLSLFFSLNNSWSRPCEVRIFPGAFSNIISIPKNLLSNASGPQFIFDPY